MKKILNLSSVLLLCFPLWAQTQPPSTSPQINQPSLGEIARKLRLEQKKESPKDVKVFTNDNMPHGGGGLSVVGPTGPGPTIINSGPSAGEPGPTGPHDEAYFRSHMAKLQQRLETDKRELSVLQQQLSQSNMQYYPDPTKTLMQEYSRSDIDKLTNQINDKQQQIAQDEQAIQDLRVQLAREGGEPGWLEPGNQGWATDIQAAQKTQARADSKAPLREQLKDANQVLANAQEQERLAENEINLLQLQQARELDPGVQADLASKISAKRAEVAAAKAAVEQAKKKIDEINREIQKQQSEEGQKSEK